jgi:hypothetical protein
MFILSFLAHLELFASWSNSKGSNSKGGPLTAFADVSTHTDNLIKEV